MTATRLALSHQLADLQRRQDEVFGGMDDLPARRARGFSNDTEDHAEGSFYVCGGYLQSSGETNAGIYHRLAETFGRLGDAWVAMQKLPNPRRAAHACAAILGKLYSFGGDGDFGVMGFTDEFNPLGHGTWTRRAPWTFTGFPWDDPETLVGNARQNWRIRHTAAYYVVGDAVYVTGGRKTVIDNANWWPRTDEYIRPPVDTWRQEQPCPLELMDHASAATTDGVYVTGGAQHEGDHPFPATDAVLLYAPATETWASKQAMPSTVREHAAVVLADELYVTAGAIDGRFNNIKTYKYDAGGDSWATLADMPYPPRKRVAGGSHDGKMVVQGGFYFDSRSIYDGRSSDADAYDPSTDAWESLGMAPSPPRFAHAGASV